MNRRIDELRLTVRTLSILKAENIRCVGDLVQRTEADLRNIPQVGHKVLNEIKEVLASHGLTLALELTRFRGHLILTEEGVRYAHTEAAISGGVPPADG